MGIFSFINEGYFFCSNSACNLSYMVMSYSGNALGSFKVFGYGCSCCFVQNLLTPSTLMACPSIVSIFHKVVSF